MFSKSFTHSVNDMFFIFLFSVNYINKLFKSYRKQTITFVFYSNLKYTYHYLSFCVIFDLTMFLYCTPPARPSSSPSVPQETTGNTNRK